MAYENLKRFMVERMLDLDPSLSDNTGSPMYERVIDPLVERLGVDPFAVDIEAFIISRIKSDPSTADLDVESLGSAMKDIIARPLALILEPLRREIEFLRTQRSLADTSLLSTEEVEALVSIFFVERNTGEYATGTARTFFSSPKSFSVDAGIVFSTTSGVQYVPTDTQTFSESDFIRSGELYYVDIDVQSTVPHSGANIDPGTLKLVSGLPGVVRVTNPTRFSQGVTEETKDALISRTKKSLTERSLNSTRGIATFLADNFQELRSIEVVGYGEPEMQRDKLTGTVTVAAVTAPGSVLATTGGLTTFNMNDAGVTDPLSTITNWAAASTFPLSNAVVVTKSTYAAFLALYNAVVDAAYVRVFSITDDWDAPKVGRYRRVLALHPTTAADVIVSYTDSSARKLRVILQDFEVIADGTTAETAPYDNAYTTAGAEYTLKGSSGNWRGAPLPFTDVIDVGAGNLSGISVVEDRDYVCIRGLATDTYTADHLRLYPVRRKLSDRHIQIKRVDHLMCRLSKSADSTYSAEEVASIGYVPPAVTAYGGPPLGDPSVDSLTMFTGTASVARGITDHGGVSLYRKAADNFAYVSLAPAASRPNGWVSLGVSVGDFISLSAYMGDSTNYTGAEAWDWWQWARIEEIGPTVAAGNLHWLKVRGIVDTGIQGSPVGVDNLLGYIAARDPFLTMSGTDPTYFGFADVSPYCLHWTVFTGQEDVITTEGNVMTSYPEFAYAPAYDTSGTPSLGGNAGLYNADPTIYYPMVNTAPLTADSAVQGTIPIFRYGSLVTATTSGVGVNNRVSWALLRFESSIRDAMIDSTLEMISQPTAAERVTLNASLDNLDKYQETATVLTDTTVLVPSISPFQMGDFQWEDVGGSPVKAVPDAPNIRGVGGFTLPTWFGTSSEFIQFYDEATSSASDPVLSISDIPGGYPFTDSFLGPLTVDPDTVHIGGATDVYVAGGAPDSKATTITCTPDDITVSSTGNIVFSSTDGAVLTAVPNELQSLNLTGSMSAVEVADLVGSVLQIVDSTDTATIGRTARILEIDYALSTIRVDGDLDDNAANTYGITFRIVSSCRTSLSAPREVLQAGTGLAVLLTDKTLEYAPGFTFDPATDGSVSIRITSGNNTGEYAVLAKLSSTRVYIDTKLNGPEYNVSFEAYTKGAPISLPLVAVTSVALAGTDNGGITVPYKHPVSSVCGALSGMNNDPITFQGNLVLRPAGTYAGAGLGTSTDPAHAAGTYATAQVFASDSGVTDWGDLGISAYDVVVLSLASGEAGYYYVDEVISSGALEVLVLSEDVSATASGLSGVVGKPSVGTMRCYFLDRTYIAMGPDTVWTNDVTTLRPSPAERALLYESSTTFTEIETTPNGPPATSAGLYSSELDFHALGVKPGDYVYITSKVLQSAQIANATAANMAASIGKTLILTVDGVKRGCTFSAVSSGLTLDNIVQQLNALFGGAVTFKNIEDPTDVTKRLLKMYSVDSIVVNDSSTGLLAALGLSSGQSNRYGAAEVRTLVTSVAYNSVTSESSLVVVEDVGDIPDTITPEVFIRIERPSWQIFFPGDMVEGPSGLYYVDVTVTTRSALTTEVVSAGDQFTADGYESLGYSLYTENDNYSFSAAEVVYLDTTPFVLDDTATSFESGFVVTNSDVTVEYTRSQLTADVQSFLLDKYSRVVNNNPLARHFFPTYLRAALAVTGGGSTDSLVNALLSDISAIYPSKTVEAFDLEVALYRQGVTYVRNPIIMVFVSHNADRTITAQHSGDSLTLGKRYNLMSDGSEITVTRA